jgi:hypothetical protein
MDFRVTHFLVAGSAQNAASNATLTALTNGTLAVYRAFSASDNVTPTDSETGAYNTGTPLTVPFYFAQGLDRTDAIEKELGVIKSGIINPSKIVSVRKLVGSSARSRQVKFFGTATSRVFYSGTATADGNASFTAAPGTFYTSNTNNHLYYCIAGGSTGAALATTAPACGVGGTLRLGAATFIYMGTTATASLGLAQFSGPSATTGSLEIEADKEYSFSVRVRSAKANTISPFGITRGYSSGAASSVFVNPSTGATQSNNAYAPFAAMFGLVKSASVDPMLTEFARVSSYMTLCNSSNGTVSDHVIFTYDDTITTTAKVFLPTSAGNIATPMPFFIASSGTATAAPLAVVINVKNYVTWNEALAAARALSGMSGFYTPAVANASIAAGNTYTASLILEGLDQTNFNLTYSAGVTDLTAYPFKFDYVRLNGYFLEGPYGNASFVTNSNVVLPINASVSTQTPITFDKTQSGLITVASILSSGTLLANTYTVLPGGMVIKYTATGTVYSFEDQIKFPNLMKEEVRHLAHQYQSYSLKYKQQFRNPRYNTMVMDPFQSKINADGPYTLYYVEYAPEVDVAYTSTQNMTNMTILAVPTANNTLITFIDGQFSNELTETAS